MCHEKARLQKLLYLMFSQLTFNTLKGPVYVCPLIWRRESVRTTPNQILTQQKEKFMLDIKKACDDQGQCFFCFFLFNRTLANIWRNYKRQWYFTSGFTSSVVFHLTISITRDMKFWLSTQYTVNFSQTIFTALFPYQAVSLLLSAQPQKQMNQKPYFQGFLATKLHSE